MATVFVADRDDASRKTLAHHLRQRGHDVSEFSSGAELYAEAVGAEPDLIVLETDLADMDGFQVFARLRRKRPDAPFPVVFVTEFEHPRVARVLKQRGALGYVGKNRPPEQLAEAVQAFLPHDDPLYQRRLPAALAWLQSRGKTGRLEVEWEGEQGYVMLHRGRVLEASWRGLRGEEALTLFAEGLADASFHFAEGIDETDVGDELLAGEAAPEAGPAAVQEEGALLETSETVHVVPEGSAAGDPARSITTPPSAPSPEAPPAREPRPAPAGPAPFPAEPGGAVAAVLAMRGRQRRRDGGRRVLLGLAAGVVLLLLGGLAVAVLFPAYVPAGLAAILDDLGVAPATRQVAEPVPQLARSGDEEPDEVQLQDEVPPRDPGPAERGAALTDSATSPTADGAVAGGEAESAPDEALPEIAQAIDPPPAAAPPEPAAARPPPPAPRPAPPPPPAPRTQAGNEPAPPPPAAPRAEPRDEPALARVAPPPAPRPGPPAAPTRRSARPPAEADGDGVRGDRPAAQPAAAAEEPAAERLVQRPVLLQRGIDPYYPPELRAEGVGGTVILRIRVGSNGRAQQVDLQRSSGHEAFDQAAIAAVGTFLWEPARNLSGPTETWITQAVTFRP